MYYFLVVTRMIYVSHAVCYVFIMDDSWMAMILQNITRLYGTCTECGVCWGLARKTQARLWLRKPRDSSREAW